MKRRIKSAKAKHLSDIQPYTDEEIRKLLKLSKEPGGKTFDSAEAFLRYLFRAR